MLRDRPLTDQPGDTNVAMRPSRRPHTKTRNGCDSCKSRKVKCDEKKPVCSSCRRFKLPCGFSQGLNHPSDSTLSASQKRGRGRPRKDWLMPREQSHGLDVIASPSSIFSGVSTPTAQSGDYLQVPSVNVSNAELQHQFCFYTASSFTTSEKEGGQITRFWSHNVPQIGFSHTFVLHLSFAVAAYHLAHIHSQDTKKRNTYRNLAKSHETIGLAGFTAALDTVNKDNCGALYVAATLVCYCTFAAGPKSPEDVLVCRLGDNGPTSWQPLIHGVRLIRSDIAPDVLFSGLMAPLGPQSVSNPDTGPLSAREEFSRINWEQQLQKLREMVQASGATESCLRSMGGLASIYRAIYGNDSDGRFDGPQEDQFVFGWIYRLDNSFVAQLSAMEPLALLILAYYCPLLRTMDTCWYMEGWANHILTMIRNTLKEGYTEWLQWPVEQCR